MKFKYFLEDLILLTIKGFSPLSTCENVWMWRLDPKVASLLKRHYLNISFQPWLHVVESCMFSLCLMPHLKLQQHFIYGMNRGQHDQNFQGEIGIVIRSWCHRWTCASRWKKLGANTQKQVVHVWGLSLISWIASSFLKFIIWLFLCWIPSLKTWV